MSSRPDCAWMAALRPVTVRTTSGAGRLRALQGGRPVEAKGTDPEPNAGQSDQLLPAPPPRGCPTGWVLKARHQVLACECRRATPRSVEVVKKPSYGLKPLKTQR